MFPTLNIEMKWVDINFIMFKCNSAYKDIWLLGNYDLTYIIVLRYTENDTVQ